MKSPAYAVEKVRRRPQALVVFWLLGRGKTMSDIAREVGVDLPRVHYWARKLERGGLVKLVASDFDRREREPVITELGRAVYGEVEGRIGREIGRFLRLRRGDCVELEEARRRAGAAWRFVLGAVGILGWVHRYEDGVVMVCRPEDEEKPEGKRKNGVVLW